MDPLVTLANLLFVSAYFVRRVIYLRALALCGACCMALYFYTLPQPLMHVVYWNLLYVAINATWLTRLLLRQSNRRSVPAAPRTADRSAVRHARQLAPGRRPMR